MALIKPDRDVHSGGSRTTIHSAILTAVCIGAPLLLGYSVNRLDAGCLSCLGGLVIMYLPPGSFILRTISMMVYSFGFILGFTVGLVFDRNPYISAVIVGAYAMLINWLIDYFDVPPPGNYFFIMITAIASFIPFDHTQLPTNVGMVALGVTWSTVFAAVYNLAMDHNSSANVVEWNHVRNPDRIYQSGIVGIFMCIAVLVGHLVHLLKGVWIPISCLSVMQGLDVRQVTRRMFYRIAGTFMGIGLTLILVNLGMTLLAICIVATLLQVIAQVAFRWSYFAGMIFVTPMTFFLGELSQPTAANEAAFGSSRVSNIIIGSLIGLVGGWIYHLRKQRSKKRPVNAV